MAPLHSVRPRAISRIAWLEPSRLPFGFDDQNIYSGILFPRAGPKMAGLLQSLGYEIEVISGELSAIDVDEIARDFDLACISVLSNTTPHGLVLGRWLTERGLPVVMGGYQFAHNRWDLDALATTAEALDFVPYVIRGEGYAALPRFLQALDGKLPFSSVGGLSYRTPDGRTIHNGATPLLDRDQMNELPLADWSAVRDVETLFIVSAHGMQGCPRSCSWCAVWTRDGQRNRNTAAERLVDELEGALSVTKCQHVFFSADNFPVIHTWATEVCEEILHRGLDVSWTCQGEVAAVQRTELVELMARAGCRRWCIGLESINNASLADSNKRQTRETMEEAIRMLHERGVHVHGMFIVGLPHDTPETIRETVAWAKRMRIETCQFLCLADLPGSSDYEQHRLWEKSFRPLTDAYEPLNWMFVNGHYGRLGNEVMPPAVVQRVMGDAMLSFYSLPRALSRLVTLDMETFRVARRQGKGWFRSLREAHYHNLIVAFLRLRGWRDTHKWLKVPINQTYLRLLDARPEEVPALSRELVSHLPPEWVSTFERVYAERLERDEEALEPLLRPVEAAGLTAGD
ncbi:MAG: radical SAM protein [Armatimonadetes bacterium]|nr:radical SAM protein [Armatimonadota bacterium]